MERVAHNCLECEKALKGRTDKKFCDDYCRNAYNNKQNSDQNNFVRNINNALRKNRRVLEGLIPPGEGMGKATRQKFITEGFNFKYHTHQYANKKGNIYFFCYEYGYLALDEDWFLIVRRMKD